MTATRSDAPEDGSASVDPEGWEPEVEEIERRKRLAHQLGGEERIQQHHDNGRLTVRERIDALLDPGTFRERGVLAGAGEYGEDGRLTGMRPSSTVMGLGRVDGRPVVVTGGDFTARAGGGSTRATASNRSGRGPGGFSSGNTMGGGNKGVHAEEMALELQVPIVRLIDGFGADVRSVEGMGRTYLSGNTMWALLLELMNEVPVVSVPLGSVAGLPAAQVAAAHFAVMPKLTSQVFAAGPPVVERALGLKVDKEALGGHRVHARGSGLVDNEAEDEHDALRQVRQFLSYLPSSVYKLPPVVPCDDPADRRDPSLVRIIPRERNRGYDVRKLVRSIVDRGSVFEIGRYFGRSQTTMLARIGGRPVGILANDPMQYGGSMDAASAQKLAKFVNLCDTFNLPIVNFVDQPGFMVGPQAEADGTLKHGLRGLAAIYAATVPWATVIVRRVYGVAGGGQQNHARYNFRVAWPSGEWGSIPVEGGVMAAYKREIAAAEDPDAYRRDLEKRLQAMRSPFPTAEAYNIEDIIDPRETRPLLHEWTELAYEVLPSLLGKKQRPLVAL